MWSRFIRGGANKTSNKTHNVDEEYNDLSTKAQKSSDILTPCQETISTILDSLTTPKKKNNLKPILSAYFDISAEAAIICTRLLNRIHRVQSDHRRIQALLHDDGLLSSGAVGPELHSLSTLLTNPFSDTHNLIMGEHFSSSVLLLEQHLLRSRNKRKVELAAKGTYIVKRDLETMSRSVRRIQDEIEHNREMIRLCLDRREDSLSLGVVLKEMKNKSCGFGLQVEELQQHVCLCLVTINRVRTLVINEIVETRL
ncbi:hypothetical protein DM860_017014 [Cuscuta australis]|uniref:Uncharacterized protein n=1 Tax=Cuscuta australis TaxID=267555 RepID=A0A328DSI7_9ASTE|nr:hypothetical protein DM860_017014 [Cuscuta australis]